MCRDLHEQEGTKPPCKGCERHKPCLQIGNREAWALWSRCQTQIKYAGMTGVCVGIDYIAMKLIAETLGIEFTEKLLNKIQTLESILVKEVNKNGRKED